jgi:hypothetical protein
MAVPLIVQVRTASGVAMQTCGIVHWHEVDVLRSKGRTRMGQSCSCSVLGTLFMSLPVAGLTMCTTTWHWHWQSGTVCHNQCHLSGPAAASTVSNIRAWLDSKNDDNTAEVARGRCPSCLQVASVTNMVLEFGRVIFFLKQFHLSLCGSAE